MEENNTEYIETEPGTEEIPSNGYAGDATEESTDSGTNMEESGDNGNDSPDSTDSNTDDGTLSDTGTDTAAPSGTPSDVTGNSSDVTDGDLLESLDALIKALSPEEDAEAGETDGTGTDENTSEPEISEYDTQTLETLQGIQSTLAAIQAENELWHTETLKYREETRETQESVIVHLEYASLLLIAIGFFVAFLCGGKFADIFFKRMKGDGRNE
jgi:hypothetical protein